MSHDSAFRRKDLLTPATTQRSLEDSTLMESARTYEDKHCAYMRPLEESHSERQSLMVGAGDWGRG